MQTKTSFEIDKFLDDQEIKFLHSFIKNIPDQKNSGNEFKAFTNGFEYNLLHPSIRQKIEKQIGKQQCTISMILKEYHPWYIHTDYAKNDSHEPSWAVLIPLEFTTDTHTVVFAEQEKKTFNEYKNNHKEKNFKFNKHQKNLMSHIDETDLQYVSDPIFYKWKTGNLIAWDRKFLHCSDNFKRQPGDYKIALVIFYCRND